MQADLLKKYEPKESSKLEYERQLWEARFTPCGNFLVADGYDATIQRWRVTADGFQPLPAFTGHDGWVQCLAPIGNERLVSADSWGRVSLWKYSAADAAKPLWTIADALGGRVMTNQLGMLLLQLLQRAEHTIVLDVRHCRLIKNVITITPIRQLLAQLASLLNNRLRHRSPVSAARTHELFRAYAQSSAE